MFLLVVVVALLLAGCAGPSVPEPPEQRHVTLVGVVVESVPADTGFWARTSRGERVWVRLVLPGRAAMPVQEGERLDVTGVVVPHGPGFAARAGVTAARDVELLTRQGSHLQVDQADVRVVADGKRV